MSKEHNVENYYLALLAPYCISQDDFLLLPDLRFPCQDLWEEQWEKTVAYTQALHYWAERANPPTLGQPCLLAGSILELQKVMELYILFSDDIILHSVALPEGFFRSQTSVSTDALSIPLTFHLKKYLHPLAGPLRSLHLPRCHIRSG